LICPVNSGGAAFDAHHGSGFMDGHSLEGGKTNLVGLIGLDKAVKK
jgi:hypothetical protein